VKRREFITGLGSGAAWPVAAQAQRPATLGVGFLSSQSADSDIIAAPFKQGLKETGAFIEGRNVAIEYRFAENQFDRLRGASGVVIAGDTFFNRRTKYLAALAAAYAADHIAIP
jgi:putative ABC transport system substrate-binding protein